MTTAEDTCFEDMHAACSAARHQLMAAAPFDFCLLVLLLGSVCMSQAFCKLAASCKDDVPGTVSCCMLPGKKMLLIISKGTCTVIVLPKLAQNQVKAFW